MQTVLLRRLYIQFVIELATRRVASTSSTTTPTGHIGRYDNSTGPADPLTAADDLIVRRAQLGPINEYTYSHVA